MSLAPSPRPLTPEEQARDNLTFELEQNDAAIEALAGMEKSPERDEKLRTMFEYSDSLEKQQAEMEMGVGTSAVPLAPTQQTNQEKYDAYVKGEQKEWGDAATVVGRAALAAGGRVAAGAGKAVLLAAGVVPGIDPDMPAYQRASDDFLTALRGQPYNDKTPLNVWLPERAVEMGIGAAFGIPNKGVGLVSVLKNAGMNAGLGAALMYDETTTLAQKSGSIALAAVAGPVLALGMHGVQAGTRGGMQWWLNRKMKDPDSVQAAAVERLKEQYPEVAEYITFGQETGALPMAKEQAAHAGKYALQSYRQQQEILREASDKYAQRFGNEWTPAEAGAQLMELGPHAAQRGRAAIKEIRAAEWDSMMDSAEIAITTRKIAGEGVVGSEQVVFDASRVDEALLQLADDFGMVVPRDPLSAGAAGADSVRLSPALQKLRVEIAAFGGNISMETLVATLKRVNSENFNPLTGPATADAQRAFGAKVKQALFGAIDDVPDGTSDAMTWIKRARQSYAQRSNEVAQFDASATARALGLNTPHADPEAAFNAIANASRGEQNRMRDVLSKYEPELLNQLRSAVWKKSMSDAIDRSVDFTKGTFDPLAHANRMLELVGTEADELGGLFGQAEAAQIRAMMEPVRAIAFSRQFLAKTQDLEGLSMVGGGLLAPTSTMPWLMRAGVRMFFQLDEMLYTKAGREEIMKVYQSIGSPGYEAALGRLIAGGNFTNDNNQRKGGRPRT